MLYILLWMYNIHPVGLSVPNSLLGTLYSFESEDKNSSFTRKGPCNYHSWVMVGRKMACAHLSVRREKWDRREGKQKDGQREREELSVHNYLTSLVFLVCLLQGVRSGERCTVSPPFTIERNVCYRREWLTMTLVCWNYGYLGGKEREFWTTGEERSL